MCSHPKKREGFGLATGSSASPSAMPELAQLASGVALLTVGGLAAGAAGLACCCACGDALGEAPPPAPGASARVDRPLPDPTRVWVVGHSGTGKTTTARNMAAKLGALHVDLDELHWLPGWQERPGDEMRAMLAAHLATAPGGRWVISGNYQRFVGEMLRDSMTALVWAHPLFYANQRQIWRRTAARWLDGGTCCNGNTESLQNILQLNNGSILYWCWFGRERCTGKIQLLIDEVLATGKLRPEDVLELRSLADADSLVAAC